MTTSKKTIIGLTGNIATGKSVVRKMLEHLGAYGIDADQLSHRVISKGAPGYEPVVSEFGKFVLDGDGEIDRKKLGNIVFSDQEALKKLELIIHPFVRKAIDHLLKNTSHNVVVVEAIKLLESPLREILDSIWVTDASEKTQIERLMTKKGWKESEALQRIKAQSPQKDKIANANYVINNDGDFENTWKQVQANWEKMFPDSVQDESEVLQEPSQEESTSAQDLSELKVIKATPKQAEGIANFVNRLSGGKTNLTRIDIMAAFGEKAYMLILANSQIYGVLGWQVENLVAKVDEVWIDPSIEISTGLKFGLGKVEEASHELQAEAALVFVEENISTDPIWAELGYEVREPTSLNVSAWQDAAKGPQGVGRVLMFKQLRVDRVLKPI